MWGWMASGSSGWILEFGDSGDKVSAPTSQRWGVQGDGGGGQTLLKQHQKNFGAAGICVPDLWLSSPGETGRQAPRKVPRAFQGGKQSFYRALRELLVISRG